jgi:hypothetical protein
VNNGKRTMQKNNRKKRTIRTIRKRTIGKENNKKRTIRTIETLNAQTYTSLYKHKQTYTTFVAIPLWLGNWHFRVVRHVLGLQVISSRFCRSSG